MSAMTPTQMNQFWLGQQTAEPPIPPPPPPSAGWPQALLALVVIAGGAYVAFRLFRRTNVDAAGVKENVEKEIKATKTPIDGGSDYERYMAAMEELRK